MTGYIDKDKLEASICRESFYWFVRCYWETYSPEKPIWNWHIKVLCDELQNAAERVFIGEKKKHDVVINIPPGTTKSTICSRMFPAWCWVRMPTCRIISCSYTDDLARTLSRESRDIITSEKYQRTFPGITLRKDTSGKSYFENTQGGWRKAVGIDGTITGFHAHFIIVDDPLNPAAAARVSGLDLASANHYVSETLTTRKVDKKVAVMFMIMQRLHQNDPSGVLLAKAKEKHGSKVRHICLPGEIDTPDEVKPLRYAKHYVGGLLDPVRMDRETLQGMFVDMGQYGYSGQIKQQPTPRGGGMFKVGLIEIAEPPPLRHFKKVGVNHQLARYWDKAGTQDGGCNTAGVLLGEDTNGHYWVLDVVLGQWDSGRREAIIKQTAQLDSPMVTVGVEQEPGSGGKESAQNTAKNLAGFRVRLDRPTGSKETRADTFSVQVNIGNVKMKPGVWNRVFLDELQMFPRGKFKDQVDAASGAFGILTKKKKRAGGMW